MDEKIDLSGLRILVVDDNNYMRQILKTILRGFGVTNVREATDGSDALKVIGNGFIPDVVLVDIEMAPMNGLDFVAMLRQGVTVDNVTNTSSAPKDIPAIMITSNARLSVVEKARAVGVSGFLVKPVKPKDVFARIVKVLNLSTGAKQA